ncbi:chlorohydrolase [Streptococcus pneumoniae]|nr:chlorohydrolase [Streptococcus pneumoniae]
MKIKEETSKLVADCPKHRFEVVDKRRSQLKHSFEVVDRIDEVSSKHRFEVADI